MYSSVLGTGIYPAEYLPSPKYSLDVCCTHHDVRTFAFTVQKHSMKKIRANNTKTHHFYHQNHKAIDEGVVLVLVPALGFVSYL